MVPTEEKSGRSTMTEIKGKKHLLPHNSTVVFRLKNMQSSDVAKGFTAAQGGVLSQTVCNARSRGSPISVQTGAQVGGTLDIEVPN